MDALHHCCALGVLAGTCRDTGATCRPKKFELKVTNMSLLSRMAQNDERPRACFDACLFADEMCLGRVQARVLVQTVGIQMCVTTELDVEFVGDGRVHQCIGPIRLIRSMILNHHLNRTAALLVGPWGHSTVTTSFPSRFGSTCKTLSLTQRHCKILAVGTWLRHENRCATVKGSVRSKCDARTVWTMRQHWHEVHCKQAAHDAQHGHQKTRLRRLRDTQHALSLRPSWEHCPLALVDEAHARQSWFDKL